jgi:hypothetical protein
VLVEICEAFDEAQAELKITRDSATLRSSWSQIECFGMTSHSLEPVVKRTASIDWITCEGRGCFVRAYSRMASWFDPSGRSFAKYFVFFGSPHRYTVRMWGSSCKIIVSATSWVRNGFYDCTLVSNSQVPPSVYPRHPPPLHICRLRADQLGPG